MGRTKSIGQLKGVIAAGVAGLVVVGVLVGVVALGSNNKNSETEAVLALASHKDPQPD
jgi:hypothetical protein